MKKGLLTSLVFLYCNLAFAQAPDTLWTKTFGGIGGEGGHFVRQTTDGGYIIVGNTDSYGAGNVWLIKTNDSGDTSWTKTFGGIYSESGLSVEETTDGGYIVVGSTNSFGAGMNDVWLIKTNSLGDTLWTKTFGGSWGESGSSGMQTADGGYIIAGHRFSFGAGNWDVWLIKTDSIGNTQWAKTFSGNNDDWGNSVQQTTDGGYIVVGSTNSFGAGMNDVWLIRTNESGNTLWTKTFGGSYAEGGSSVQQTNDAGYIIVRNTNSFGAGFTDVWLIKTNESGDTLWTKTFGGYDSEVGISVQNTTDSGYIIIGQTSSFGAGFSDFWLIKANESGDTLWTKTFGGISQDDGYSVKQTADGGYILVGNTNSFGAGMNDVWLIKTTPDVSGIEPNTDLMPTDFSLSQNYPNPFNPSTKISWQSPIGSWQTLKIYDVLGNEVATLVDEYKPAGSYEVEFNSSSGIRDLASGIYFYQLRTKNYIETKKMILLK